MSRTRGAINRRTIALQELLANAGAKDPALYLSEIADGKIAGVDHQLRVTASIALMPYLHSRRQNAPLPPVYTANPVEIDPPKTLVEIQEMAGKLLKDSLAGRLDHETAKVAVMELQGMIANLQSGSTEDLVKFYQRKRKGMSNLAVLPFREPDT
jgi:hypothetical protein